MKNLGKLFFATALTAAFISCEKDDDSSSDSGSSTTKTCQVDSSIVVSTPTNGDPASTHTQSFKYNADGKLETVNNYESGQLVEYATLTYNASGQLEAVMEYDAGSSTASTTYEYGYDSDGNMTQIVESGTDNSSAYILTTTMTYSGGKLASASTVQTSGSKDPEPGVDNVVWTNNNISSLDMVPMPSQSVTLNATYDSKDNVSAKIMYPKTGTDLIMLETKNNLSLVVAATSNAIIEVTAGDTILYNTFTYDANANVETMTMNPTKMDDDKSEVSTFVWTCE